MRLTPFPFLALTLLLAFTAFAQGQNVASSVPIELEGPRIGATLLSQKFIDSQEDAHHVKLRPMLAQIGWHFEKRFFTMSDGGTAVSEVVALVGGFEQGSFIPSVSWLLGFRAGSGVEFGMGPNLSLAGSAAVFAVGMTFQSEEVNFPVNFALATSDDGPRYSLLIGFNLKTPSYINPK